MPMFYRPMFQNFEERPYYVHVQVAGHPAAVIAAIRREIQSMDPDISVYDIRTIREVIDRSLQPDRMFAVLATVFGILALLLTSIGIYGVVAYQITRRTGEIGIRMALGAQRGNVVWLFMQESLLVLTVGAAIGLPCAIAAAHLLRSRPVRPGALRSHFGDLCPGGIDGGRRTRWPFARPARLAHGPHGGTPIRIGATHESLETVVSPLAA